MTQQELNKYTLQENAQFWARIDRAEEEFGVDTFDPSLERHHQKWQARKDKVLAQIAETSSSDYKELLQQKLSELELAWKRSSENLIALRQMHRITK
jgi:hypothetical protein